MLEIKKYQKVSINSEKNFGIVFSFFFIIVFSYYAFFKDQNFYWLIYVSFFFLLFSFIKSNIFYLPNKICCRCGRPFIWRKKWKDCWYQVKYCSRRCRTIKG